MSLEDSLRIVFKSDLEAGTNNGARMYADHFEGPVGKLIPAMARAAKRLVPDADTLRVTEGYRPPRRAGDLHSTLDALDFTIVKRGGIRATNAEYVRVAEAVRAELGDATYDFQVHGTGLNEHIHAEVDPK